MSNWCLSSSAIVPLVTEPNSLPSSPVLTLMMQTSLERLGEVVHVVELLRLALGALLPERFELALVRRRDRHGEALRIKIVARVAGGDADVVGFTAEADDVVREDDFSFCHTKILWLRG